MVTALQAQEWETLLQRVGEDAMFHLLTETSVFVSLPNGCLCQMTGDPVLHMKPSVAVPVPTSDDARRGKGHDAPRRGTKRRCMNGYSEERPPKRRKRALATAPTAPSDQLKPPRTSDPSRSVQKITHSRALHARPHSLTHR
ncbi:hypothetical protein BD309DRAFT_1039323 [Dichomitus squalens]|nr:hypothetical protein BD309DRAFT_1039323 [Dichomitus squalens]